MSDPFNAAANQAEIDLAQRLQDVLEGKPTVLCLRAIGRVLAQRDPAGVYDVNDAIEIVSQRARLYVVIGAVGRREPE